MSKSRRGAKRRKKLQKKIDKRIKWLKRKVKKYEDLPEEAKRVAYRIGKPKDKDGNPG